MVNKSIHRTNQFRIPCPQCTHSILVTEKPQAMFAAFQILSFERSGIADQLHKKHLSPIRPEGTNVPKQKTYRPFYRGSPFERLCRVAETKKLCFRTTFRPGSTLRQSALDFALPHAARPSLRWTGGDLANSWFSPASHTTNFYLQTAPDKFVHPENKKGCKRMFATQPTTRSFAEREGFEPITLTAYMSATLLSKFQIGNETVTIFNR